VLLWLPRVDGLAVVGHEHVVTVETEVGIVDETVARRELTDVVGGPAECVNDFETGTIGVY